MFIFVACDVSPFAGFAWFLARAVLKSRGISLNYGVVCMISLPMCLFR